MSDPVDLNERLAGGTYAQKQIFSKDKLVAWSHSSRFRKARELVAPFAGQKLLDLGCGDGTFLAQVSDLFPDAIGADIEPDHVQDATERFKGIANLGFIPESDLDDTRYDQSFDLVTCMEVLEHCPPEKIVFLLDLFRRVLKPGGTLVVSVPIEVGPSLMLKEVGRSIAGWRKIGDYASKEKYGFGELMRMVFAGPGTTIPREECSHSNPDGSIIEYRLHKGFNWKALRLQIAKLFEIKGPTFTPLGWSRGLLSSQVWFVCRPKG